MASTSQSLALAVAVLLYMSVVPCSAAPRRPSLAHYSSASEEQLRQKNFFEENRTITVHVVPHTHDDVGWLKTVDQYYYGANDSIQHAAVQYILDSVVQELMMDPSRTFIYVEMAFFARWWEEQNDAMKHIVRKLVANKQLEFVNAGWCMNDEATTLYNAIVDQMTLGLRFVQENFGEEARPRVAWQIDPFGHSSEMASIFAKMGYDGLFFWRNDYGDRNQRLKDNTMEMVWRPSPSLGPTSDLFTGILFYGYGPPPGFCFDVKCADQPIQDDKRLFDYNVDERVDKFIEAILLQAGNYRTDHIMFTMGSDFQHQNSHEWFKNLDKLMKYTMEKEPRIKLMYSTPSRYLDAVHQADLSWTVKTDDFFPYADDPHSFWTGYFTSRPALKGYVREMNSLLQLCKQLERFEPVENDNSPLASATLQEAMGVAQHHDAVSGTEKQHVADDYAKRLHRGQSPCEYILQEEAIEHITGKGGKSDAQLPILYFCENLNISVCNATETNNFDAVIYNPAGRQRIALTKFPVNSKNFTVKQAISFEPPDLVPVTAQVVEVTNETARLRYGQSGSRYELVVAPTVPALGGLILLVREANLTDTKSPKVTSLSERQEIPKGSEGDITIENDDVLVSFDSINGMLRGITNKQSKVSVNVHQGFYWYHSYGMEGRNEPPQRSGAYIFRPVGDKPFDVTEDGEVEKISVVKGDVYMEVHQVFSSWVSQTVRIFPGQPFVEFEYTVGPIPVEDGIGKEIITRFSTDMDTDKTWYTDSNGREMQKRVRNYRPTWKYDNTEPIAGNYYPVNSRMYMRDDSRNVQFTILTDRSHGGASLEDGQMELMLHRRTLFDDSRGVDESLNEGGVDGKGLVIRGHFIVLVDNFENSYNHRLIGEFLMMRTVMVAGHDKFIPPKFIQNIKGISSGVVKDLPPNIRLMTLQRQRWSSNKYILRLEHQFAVGEGKLAVPQNVSLSDWLSYNITSMTELSLGANSKLPITRLKWKTDSFPSSSPFPPTHPPIKAPDFTVELNPMEIRTFEVELVEPPP